MGVGVVFRSQRRLITLYERQLSLAQGAGLVLPLGQALVEALHQAGGRAILYRLMAARGSERR